MLLISSPGEVLVDVNAFLFQSRNRDAFDFKLGLSQIARIRRAEAEGFNLVIEMLLISRLRRRSPKPPQRQVSIS